MIKTNEVIIKVVSKLDSYYGKAIDMTKAKEILDEALYDYDIVDKEKALTIINNDLNEKAFLFVATKKIDGLSETTLKNYGIHLRHFNKFMNKNIKDITTMDIRMYLIQYAKTGVKKSTISTKQDVLRSYFGWLSDEGYIEKNPMKLIKPIRVEKSLRKALTKEELEILRCGAKTLRQQAILEVFYSTGARLDELVNMNINSIDWMSLAMNIVGKGSKERVVYISPRCKVILKQYLTSRNDECEALFATTRKPYRRMGRRSVEREIKKIQEQSELDKNVYCHRIRHTAATHWLNNGMTITEVGKILGHESIATTEIYSQISSDEVHHSFKKYA